MRHLLLAVSILLGSATAADAQVSFQLGVAVPGVQIGINVPAYPRLVAVPGYPVYYAPAVGSNYFFYDGAYWVFQGDAWYVSSWYAGPWYAVAPEHVPVFLLRVPVRYYRVPPPWFRGWAGNAPPRWADHWGHDWEARRAGWDRWDRRSVPRPAPLPAYQRRYAGPRYPQAFDQQRAIRAERYGYHPREEVTRQHYGEPAAPPRGEGRGEGHRRGGRGER